MALKAGPTAEAMRTMMPTTTSNSTNVKPWRFGLCGARFMGKDLGGQECSGGGGCKGLRLYIVCTGDWVQAINRRWRGWRVFFR